MDCDSGMADDGTHRFPMTERRNQVRSGTAGKTAAPLGSSGWIEARNPQPLPHSWASPGMCVSI